MSIATAGGPCSQPQDLPWLSFNPTSGTTAPGDTTNVSMGVDGTGSVDGDVLAGTMCTVSNDPDTRTVETAITINVTTGGGGTVIDSDPIYHSIIPDITGLYINWLTGSFCDSDTTCSGSYDFSAYSSNGGTTGNVTFYYGGPVATTSRCVWDGTSCSVLTSGAVIGPASTFGSGNAAAFLPGGSLYYGFSFVNANTSQVNYGYAKFTFTGPTGFPVTLNEYWYDNSGAAITIP